MLPKRAAIQHYWPASSSAHIAGRRCRPFCINVLPFSLHGFPAPFRRRFPALLLRVIAVYPMQTVMRLSRCGAGFGNKKSPHNNLNLTIPSGMALVRVCYVAIRKSKTCSGSFRSRAGTLSKYVILNCRDRLPQKSSHVNVNLSGARPLHLAAQDRSVA